MHRLCGTDASEEVLEHMANTLVWGSYGVSGREPLKLSKFYQLESDHIENILTFCNLHPMTRRVFLYILRKRQSSSSSK